MTAHFGNEAFSFHTKICSFKKERSFKAERQVESKSQDRPTEKSDQDQIFNSQETQIATEQSGDAEERILYETIAKKKSRMIFYNTRRIVLHTDGSFCYYEKKSKNVKRKINPSEIRDVERVKSNLTIFLNCTDLEKNNQFCFRFASQAEAR